MNEPGQTANYGIRIELPEGDPFGNLVGEDWTTEHWFDSPTARDRALADMSQEHVYSRRGDQPALIFTPIERNLTGI